MLSVKTETELPDLRCSELPYFKDTVSRRYDMSDEEAALLCVELTEDMDGEGGKYVCVELEGSDPRSDVGRYLERKVFNVKFPSNDAVLMESEYGMYEASSGFFVVIDNELDKPVGVLRYIKDSEVGLKTLNDINRLPLCSVDGVQTTITPEEVANFHGISDMSKCWDVGTIAVDPDYRGNRSNMVISNLLHRSVYASALARGVDFLIAIIDRGEHANLDRLGVPFKSILDSGPFEYLDSESSTALIGYVPEFEPVMRKIQVDLAARSGLMAKFLSNTMDSLLEGKDVDHMINFPFNR